MKPSPTPESIIVKGRGEGFTTPPRVLVTRFGIAHVDASPAGASHFTTKCELEGAFGSHFVVASKSLELARKIVGEDVELCPVCFERSAP